MHQRRQCRLRNWTKSHASQELTSWWPGSDSRAHELTPSAADVNNRDPTEREKEENTRGNPWLGGHAPRNNGIKVGIFTPGWMKWNRGSWRYENWLHFFLRYVAVTALSQNSVNQPSHLCPFKTSLIEFLFSLIMNLSLKRRDSIVRWKLRGLQMHGGRQVSDPRTDNVEKCPGYAGARLWGEGGGWVVRYHL